MLVTVRGGERSDPWRAERNVRSVRGRTLRSLRSAIAVGRPLPSAKLRCREYASCSLTPPPLHPPGWDAEILMSQGWVECVGHADRSAFDLKVHSKATKVELVAREIYPEPREETVMFVKSEKGLMGKTFGKEMVGVMAAIEELCLDVPRATAWGIALATSGSAVVTLASGSTITVTSVMLSVVPELKKISERKYVPNVIEPSFGIGRIITGVWEHTFYVRSGGDEQRAVLALPPAVAPYKVVLLPLDARIDATAHVAPIASKLNSLGLAALIDDSGASIGKRYARADEVGTPYACTVDHQSVGDGAVTLRERDSTAQVRLPAADVPHVVRALCEGAAWADVTGRYPSAKRADDEDTVANGGAGATAAAATTASSNIVSTTGGLTVGNGKVTLTGTVGVTVEGGARSYGRFARPADLQK